jgi:hypothetical protein
MAELPITKELAEKLIRLAQRQKRPLEEILEAIVELEKSSAQPVYEHIEEDPRYKAAEKRILPKFYARARQYWEEKGDQARLALTDAQLDEQFWCIDLEGIPRLKVDQDKLVLPPDPFESVADREWQQLQKTGRTDQVGTQDVDTRAVLNQEFPNYLLHRMDEGHGGE